MAKNKAVSYTKPQAVVPNATDAKGMLEAAKMAVPAFTRALDISQGGFNRYVLSAADDVKSGKNADAKEVNRATKPTIALTRALNMIEKALPILQSIADAEQTLVGEAVKEEQTLVETK